MEESCECEVAWLWGILVSSLLIRLAHINKGLALWFKKIQRAKHSSLSSLREKLDQLVASTPSDDVLNEMEEVRLAMNNEMDKEETY